MTFEEWWIMHRGRPPRLGDPISLEDIVQAFVLFRTEVDISTAINNWGGPVWDALKGIERLVDEPDGRAEEPDYR